MSHSPLLPATLTLAAIEVKDAVLVLAFGLLAVSVLLGYTRRRKDSAPSHPLTPEEQSERARQGRGMRGDLETLTREIEQAAQRLGAQLDAKAAHVERLIRAADERIAELKELRREGGAGAGTEAQPPVAEEPDEEPPEPDDPLTGSVYALADGGVEPAEIARRLNEHVGKVELILALRESR